MFLFWSTCRTSKQLQRSSSSVYCSRTEAGQAKPLNIQIYYPPIWDGHDKARKSLKIVSTKMSFILLSGSSPYRKFFVQKKWIFMRSNKNVFRNYAWNKVLIFVLKCMNKKIILTFFLSCKRQWYSQHNKRRVFQRKILQLNKKQIFHMNIFVLSVSVMFK